MPGRHGGVRADPHGARVDLRGVCRRFPIDDGQVVEALVDVSLTVEPGQFVAIVGPSGSGKSTLLHVVGAIDRADSGSIVVDGQQLRGLSRRQAAAYRRKVGFVFQRFNLLPALTVLDNVIAPVLPFRTEFDKRARAVELLSIVGLAGRERSLPSRLSGGQQQRVAIARALIGAPRLLLADEPTGNLDSISGAQVMDLLVRLREQHGMTVLVATHDPLIAGHCDRVVAIRDGRVMSETSPRSRDPSGEGENDLPRTTEGRDAARPRRAWSA